MNSSWINAVLLVPISALAAAVLLAHRTPDLSQVQTKLLPEEQPQHNPAALITQTAQKQSGILELTEGEVNDFLARRFAGTQAGFSSRFAKFAGVLVDLEDDLCRVHFCWDVLGHRTVASVEFTIHRTDKDFEVEILRGAYGRLAVPRGMLPLLIPAMHELANACQQEIDALFKMPHIRLARQKVVLDAKF